MKRPFFCLWIVVGIITICTTKIEAQDITKDTLRIEEVVVTGTPVKINRNNVPMSVSVITGIQLNESSESAVLPILSGRVPGLFVTERGVTGFGVSTGSAGQITIRGIGGNPTTGVLMLIDGHPQFMGIMGHPLPDSYVASDIESVEVIRGPGSVLYGSNALGGVINLITKKQTHDGFNGNARLMYGSYNTQKYMASGGYKKDKLSFFISGNHDQTNGHRPNSAFKITNGYTKLGYDLNERLKLSADFSLAAFKSSDPGPDTLSAKKGETIDITRGYGSFTADNDFGRVSGSAKLFYNFGEHKITDGFHSTDHNYGLNLFESLKLIEGNTITLGIDYMNFGGLAENLKAMLVIIKERTQEIGIQRAIGATPATVIKHIVAESVFLTVMAGYIGLSLGVGVLEILNQILLRGGDKLFFRNPEINLTMALSALAVLVVAGIFAGLIPAKRAVSIKPIDAIRDE